MVANAAWNPDAGVIPSLSDGATVIPSSGTDAGNVIDGNELSLWQSDAPFPFSYVSRSDQNDLLNHAQNNTCSTTGNVDCSLATDGDITSKVIVPKEGDKAELILSFSNPIPLIYFSIITETADPVFFYAKEADGTETLIGYHTYWNNDELTRHNAYLPEVVELKFTCADQFTLFEVAAAGSAPKESLIIDLGTNQDIGWIETKHLNLSSVQSMQVFTSKNNNNYNYLCTLLPQAVEFVPFKINPVRNARYIKIVFNIFAEDYAKAGFYEIKVYGPDGPYGARPADTPGNTTLNDFLGINGEWGWGYYNYSIYLNDNQGPGQFSQVATHARNYHEMTWDIHDPDNIPDYEAMANGEGTEALPWLNWDTEYDEWNAKGLNIQAAISFNADSLPAVVWNNPYQAAYNYANAFANHFGPTNGTGSVSVYETGNEPWEYEVDFLQTVISGMSEGVKAADPSMLVFPCALQSRFPAGSTPEDNNFSGNVLTESIAQNLDGLNAHCYSYIIDQSGKRLSVHPEHPESEFQGIFNEIRFRDTNMPGKKIFITEWGWDSSSNLENCLHDECVNEDQQTIYATRGIMYLMRLGIDRVNWYNYANSTGPSNPFTRSGLTNSTDNDFSNKKSFVALQALRNKLGNAYFLEVIQEKDDAWIYVFGSENQTPTHLVLWKPTDGEDLSFSNIKIDLPNHIAGHDIANACTIAGTDPLGEPVTSLIGTNLKKKKNNIPVSAIPLILEIGSCTGSDSDGDSVADGCDICPGFDDLIDTDGDQVPNGCDLCEGHSDHFDDDGDNVPNGCDVCPDFNDSFDMDGDGVPDQCDICEGFDDNIDTDEDGTPDGCDICPSDPANNCNEEGDNGLPTGYCSILGEDSYLEWIDKVQIGSISNQSGDDSGYGDYTNITTELVIGNTYNLKLIPGFMWSAYVENWKVWIDYNRDGDFLDIGEEVHFSSTDQIVDVSILIPETAETGLTKMRVLMSSDPTVPGSCGNFQWGEAEDYTVNITNTGAAKNQFVLQVSDLYPNPATETVHFLLSSGTEKTIEIAVYDVTLKERVSKQKTQLVKGENLISLDIHKLSEGMYYIMIQDGKNKTAESFIKF